MLITMKAYIVGRYGENLKFPSLNLSNKLEELTFLLVAINDEAGYQAKQLIILLDAAGRGCNRFIFLLITNANY